MFKGIKNFIKDHSKITVTFVLPYNSICTNILFADLVLEPNWRVFMIGLEYKAKQDYINSKITSKKIDDKMVITVTTKGSALNGIYEYFESKGFDVDCVKLSVYDFYKSIGLQ